MHPKHPRTEVGHLASHGASPWIRFSSMAIVLALTALPAWSQNLIANGTYVLTGKNSGQVVDVYGNSTTEGGLIDQWPSNSGNNQKWTLTNLGNNYVELVNVNSGLALEVASQSLATGQANIDQWPYNGGNNQKWQLISEGGGYYELVNENSGYALDVPKDSTTEGTDLDQWPPSDTANQLWSFTSTGGGAGGSTINSKLGKPNRVLIGLGAGNAISDMNSQGIKPDIIDTYLPGVGSSSWISYASPSGAYVTNTASAANAIGAIPMYTLYGMAQNGDGNLSGLSSSSFMDSYWSQARLMYQKLGSYGQPVLVNLEPDFWGYVEAQAPSNDPTQLYAVVSDQSECSSFGNNATGVAQCLLQLARDYAPKALVGYPASFFGETAPTVAAFMQKIHAQNADFIVAQTSDRDAGCAEVSSPPPECSGRTGPFYWDESNQATPNFTESLNTWSSYRGDLGGGLPIIWWQTPLGVPSSTPGGYNQHYRDDHVDYMLKNTYQYGDIDSFGIVFSAGASSQTVITTDGGEFATLFKNYLSTGGNGVVQ